MNKHMLHNLTSVTFSLAVALSTVFLSGAQASAQCPVTQLTSGLQLPLGITQSNQDNLLVSESGTRVPNTGRISIVDLNGNRRTLLDGLPSGISDVGDPSGPDGLYVRGRTLYIAIGVGDAMLAGSIPNPNPSSPLFSSILAVHFSASIEKETSQGFTLTPEARQALANGQKVTLSNDGNEQVTVELVANFPDYTSDPTSPSGFRASNPFALVAIGDQLYVTDGGQNRVRKVDIPTGAFAVLTTFPRIPNPLPFGPPVIEAVPTGIAYSGGKLLVTLFRGFPFPVGASVVEQVDPLTGNHSSFITGLKASIGVLPVKGVGDTHNLVLQHASQPGPPASPASQPGLLLRFDTPAGPPTVIANCLSRPTAMTLDEKSGTLYVTELITGRIVAIPIAP